jgi:hypothetical protein
MRRLYFIILLSVCPLMAFGQFTIQSSTGNAYATKNIYIGSSSNFLGTTIGYDFSGIDTPENDKGPYALRYADFVVPVMDEKISRSNLFNGFCLQINMWVIGRLMYNEDKSLLQEHNQQQIQSALNTGLFVDIDADMLFQQAKKYAYENE